MTAALVPPGIRFVKRRCWQIAHIRGAHGQIAGQLTHIKSVDGGLAQNCWPESVEECLRSKLRGEASASMTINGVARCQN